MDSTQPTTPRRFEVAEATGLRLDRWLSDRLPERTRNQIQKDIDNARVQVNDQSQPSRYKVQAGDRIDYQIPPDLSTEVQAESIPLKIVFEDEHLIVVDKPSGLVVHPAPGLQGGTLVNALLAHCGPSLEGVGGEDRWGIVHRLDQHTSGLLMAAKTPLAYETLVAALARRDVARLYLGIAVGYFQAQSGTIDRPIARRKSDRKRMGVVEGGREARTDWELIGQIDNLALLGLRLHSGRTHQIRVHMQSIGRPILGDLEYGWTKSRTLQTLSTPARPQLASAWIERQALHAARLLLDHPVHAACRLSFQSPLPGDMEQVMESLAPPDSSWRERLSEWFQRPIDKPERDASLPPSDGGN